jgi:hypothetical protein
MTPQEGSMSDDANGDAVARATSGGGNTSAADPQLTFLEELVEEHVSIAGDILELDAHTWAIHGSIAVDGEVIMAEYDTEEQARTILDEVSTMERGVMPP